MQALTHDPAIAVVKGMKLGTFKMGSSVLVLTEKRAVEGVGSDPFCSVQYGQSLTRIVAASEAA